MTVTVTLCIYAVGASLLAFWLVLRFPSLGPRRATSALLVAIASLGVMSIAESAVDPVAGANRYGVVLALMLVILPALTAAFWAAACMLRVLAALRPW